MWRLVVDSVDWGDGLASVTYNERHISVVRLALSLLNYDPSTILRDGATYSVSRGS